MSDEIQQSRAAARKPRDAEAIFSFKVRKRAKLDKARLQSSRHIDALCRPSSSMRCLVQLRDVRGSFPRSFHVTVYISHCKDDVIISVQIMNQILNLYRTKWAMAFE